MTPRAAALAAVFSAVPVVLGSWPSPSLENQASRPGTGSISGVIVAAENSRPVARAAVVLGGSATPGITVFTDDTGQFSFNALPAGQFTLTASKASLLTMAYGQAEPGKGSGLPVALKEAEARRDLKWALPRAGTLTGRVLDLAGQPARAAMVTVQQRRVDGGEARYRTCCGEARTDANGAYRLTGLLPGEYFVSAVPAGDYRVLDDGYGVFSEEMRIISDDEIKWALGVVKTGPGAAPQPTPAPPQGRSVALARSYFGGATTASRASPVVLALGEERGGVDMRMQLVPTALLQARAVMPDGQPPANASVVFSDGWSSSGGGLPADGRFERRNLAPGRYRLTIRGRGAAVSGTRVIDIDGTDVRDLIVAMEPAATMSGRVVFEAGDASAPVDVAQMQVGLSPANLQTPARVSADGRWNMPLIDPGRYRVNASAPPAARNAWSLKSVIAAGRDITDTGIDIGSGEALTDVVITFTSRRTALSGLLLTADDQPAAGFYVAVFSDDPAHWVTGSRRVPPPVRASTDGSYQFAGLPPGTYRLAALTHVDQADLADPAFLTALRTSAIVVRLAEGESVRQDVKFGK